MRRGDSREGNGDKVGGEGEREARMMIGNLKLKKYRGDEQGRRGKECQKKGTGGGRG